MTVALGLRVNTILSISIVGSEVLRIRQNLKGLIPIVKKGNMKQSLLIPRVVRTPSLRAVWVRKN